LLTRRRKFYRARELLTDVETTAFLLVINPERLPILESKKALNLLRKFDVPVAAMIVNRILPDDVEGDFLRKRRLQEQKYRDEINREFVILPRFSVPLLSHDIHGIDTLRRIGNLLIPEVREHIP
jgi:arsenite-transporting ATPase